MLESLIERRAGARPAAPGRMDRLENVKVQKKSLTRPVALDVITDR